MSASAPRGFEPAAWGPYSVFGATRSSTPYGSIGHTALAFAPVGVGFPTPKCQRTVEPGRGRTHVLRAARRHDPRFVAMTDPLTGCHNRRFFDQIIDREVQRHVRYNIPLTLLFVDVDRFKSVNDDMGHAMGDRLVQHVAGLLQRHVRGSDYVFRWGGDEFVALMSCTEREAGSKSAMLKAGFDSSVQRWALPPGLGLSVGCAEFGHAAGNIEALLVEADARMYADKHRRQAPVGSHLMTETGHATGAIA